MTYHHIRLADASILSGPGSLPYAIEAWAGSTLLTDLTGQAPAELGFDGTGFWVDVVTTPTFDATAQTLAGTVTWTVDATNRQVNGVEDVRALTAAELAATLAAAQQAQIATLSAACAAQIVGGFTSSALGAPHTYPSKIPTDQINLMGSVTDSLLPGLPTGWTTPFWCADASGNWSFAPHTAAQIQQAGQDGKANVANSQGKLAILTAQVMVATTVAAVSAISW